MSHYPIDPGSEPSSGEEACEIAARRECETLPAPDGDVEMLLALTGEIAHEFNNLLTAILGFSDMLLDDIEPGDARRGDLTEIRHAAERAALLTKRLLALDPTQPLSPQVAGPGGQAVAGALFGDTSLRLDPSTILLVEDEELVRSMIRTVLERLGYTILEASDGREGLAVARAHRGPIHLLLTDLSMPHVNGQQVASELSAERSGMRVLFMSGGVEQREIVAQLRQNRVPFVAKPFTPDALVQTVHELLQDPALIAS